MYAHIEGIVAEKTPDSLVIDAGGVGYLLMTSANTLTAASAVGSAMKCYTHLSVREDALDLFGFATREEKSMFEKLRSVTGIGPRTALQILSALTVRDLSIALVTGDANTLTRAPGIGKKTAQRLVLELRDKVANAELVGTGFVAPPAGNAAAEAIEALMALGYQASEAARAVAAVSPMPEEVDKIVFQALRGMGSK